MRLAAHWAERQPEGFLVFRDAGQSLIGFMNLVSLERATAADLEEDPAAHATWRYLQVHTPLRPRREGHPVSLLDGRRIPTRPYLRSKARFSSPR